MSVAHPRGPELESKSDDHFFFFFFRDITDVFQCENIPGIQYHTSSTQLANITSGTYITVYINMSF